MQEIEPIINLPQEELELLFLHCPETLEQLRLRDAMIIALEAEIILQRAEIKRWQDDAR